jgi:tRNA(fMet)-specific endonuclease VapC
VIDPSRLIVLDSNIVILLARGGDVGQSIEAKYRLSVRSERPLISVVTVGEVLTIAKKHCWPSDKLGRLDEHLRNVVVLDLNVKGILEKYADIHVFLEGQGRKLGDNDEWIAATASTASAVLLTTDKDFDVLHPRFVEREWIDPKRK